MKLNINKKYTIAGVTSMLVSMGASATDIATVQAALIAKVGEAETFGWAVLAVSLVATIGIALVKKFGRQAS